MKLLSGILLITFALCISCTEGWAQEDMSANSRSVKLDTNKSQRRAKFHLDSGMVSHRYVASGGKIVIITNHTVNGDTLIYVPLQDLNEFNAEGLEISFNYTPLGIMHQKGCGNAQPVIIRNIKKLAK